MDQANLKNEVLDFLRSHFIMSIAVAEDNKPTASILLYYIDDDFNFYFTTHIESHKTEKLRKNPLISICVWEHKKMLIQADGEVSEITDPELKLKIIDELGAATLKGDDFWPPLLRIKGEGYVIFKVKPTWLRKLDLQKDTMTQLDSPFSEITFN